MRTGIFGGTFNPPHMGHIAAAKAAKKAMKLDRVVFVPANIPPHKSLPQNTPMKEQRLFMTHMAAYMAGAEVSAWELMKEGKSYTYETMEHFKELYKGEKLFFIVGTDMLRTFEKWKNPERILACCALLALCRDEREKDSMEFYAESIRKNLGGEVHVVDNDVLKISSTDVRGGRHDMVPPIIAEYIERNRLYNDR